jgi:DNA-binding CsgD family transcriptional regulator
MPFAKPDFAPPGLPVSDALTFMIRWTECLHGDGSLRETLLSFCDLAVADVVVLHRVNAVTGAHRTIATVDRHAAHGARPLTRAHGLALVGQTLSRAKPGTVWTMRDLDRDAVADLDPRTLDWMADRGLHAASLIPLSSNADQTDVLEFYQSAPLDRVRQTGLATLASALAEAWGRRPQGRIARILRSAPAINARLAPERDVPHPLSANNPLHLTAAELRICGLIRQGMHLRSIFSKAGVTGQVGLVRLLLGPDGARPALRA